jgi:hypothetical protein
MHMTPRLTRQHSSDDSGVGAKSNVERGCSHQRSAGVVARSVAIAALAVVVLGAGPGAAWAHCWVMHHELPRDERVALHVETGRGFFTPVGTEVTIRRGGAVTIDPHGRGGSPTTLTISPAEVTRLLGQARRIGLFDGVDVGNPNITDQATTTIRVDDGDRHRSTSVYALFFGGAGYGPSDLGLTEAQYVARGKVADFVDRLSNPKTYATKPTSGIEHPTGPDDVVLHTETSKNFWGGTYPHAVTFTLYGDGRLVGGGAARQLSEAEVQAILQDAQRVGLLGGVDFGQTSVTDQGTTEIDVHAGHVDHDYAIYALELVEGDHGLPAKQRAARRALRAFLHGVVPAEV